MKRGPRVFLPANLISAFRAFLVVPTIIALHQREVAIALGLMGLGVFTDFLDGFVARKFQGISSFGKVLDPVADKITVASLLIYLGFFRDLPWWFLVILVVRDLSIAGSAAYLMNVHRKAFQANFSGKISVNLIALTIIVYVINWAPYKVYIMWLASAVMILSWIRYLRVYFIYYRIYQQRQSGREEYA